MSTDTIEQLLIVAMQDLADAELAWGQRGDALRHGGGSEVRAFLDRDLERSSGQRGRLVELIAAAGGEIEGDPNIWLRAVLDDAERDIASIAAGPLRDVALIGAFRKGKQAERVSYETAMALAARLGHADTAAALERCRDEVAGADAELAALLGQTVGRL